MTKKRAKAASDPLGGAGIDCMHGSGGRNPRRQVSIFVLSTNARAASFLRSTAGDAAKKSALDDIKHIFICLGMVSAPEPACRGRRFDGRIAFCLAAPAAESTRLRLLVLCAVRRRADGQRIGADPRAKPAARVAASEIAVRCRNCSTAFREGSWGFLSAELRHRGKRVWCSTWSQRAARSTGRSPSTCSGWP